MTAKSLILTTIGLLIFLSLVKIFFISILGLSSWYMATLFFLATLFVSTAVVRRAGVINNFEVIIAVVFWTPVVLLWDFIVLVPIVGNKMYYELPFWLGYLAMLIAIIIFHKWAPLDKD